MLFLFAAGPAAAHAKFEVDTIKTSRGNLDITFIGHGSLLFHYLEKNIFMDPYSRLADYSQFPKADFIIITHDHSDHLDMSAIDKIATPKTEFLLTRICGEKLGKGRVIKNGETINMMELDIKAVPAYNIVHMRDDHRPFHLQGDGNGYVITFGDKKVYVAGDTENIPDMKHLGKIDIAFLPMNLPYTMTPEMAADAAKMIHPHILYPYHYGDTDVLKLPALLKNEKMDIRIRKMR